MRQGCVAKYWNRIKKSLETLLKEQNFKPNVRSKCGVCNRWGHYTGQCLSKPCTICGEGNHVANQCQAKVGGSGRAQGRGGFREIYGISSDQLKIKSMVSIIEPFYVVDSELVSEISEVNAVDVNKSNVQRLIYVRDLLGEKLKVQNY